MGEKMKIIKSFKLTMVVIVLILVGILMPGDSVPSVGIPGMDKIVHFGMFFVLTGTFYFEYFMSEKRLPRFWMAFVGVGAFAISTEVMQLCAISRSFDLKDFLVDMMGYLGASGLWIGSLVIIKKNKR